MPSVTKISRIVQIATLPETRRAIVAAARSDTLRTILRRASSDRNGLMRDLRNPANARDVIRGVARHPAAHELADASLLIMPGRYLAVRLGANWAARRLLRRLLRRYVDRPADVLQSDDLDAHRPRKNVMPGPR